MRKYSFVLLALSFLLAEPAAFGAQADQRQAAFFITGLAGSHEFRINYRGAVRSLASILELNGYAYSDMVRLADEIEAEIPWGKAELSSGANIRKVIDEYSRSGKFYDKLFIFIAGHANGRDEEAVFHLPGEDIEYKELMRWLDNLPAKETIVIVAAPQGHAWVEQFSKPGRIVLAAGGLREFDFIPATFLRFFPNMFRAVAKRESESGPSYATLRDVFLETQKRVQEWYERNNLKTTELAVIDADGDGKAESMIQKEILVEKGLIAQEQGPAGGSQSPERVPEFRKWVPEEEQPLILMTPDVPDGIAADKIIFLVSGGETNVG